METWTIKGPDHTDGPPRVPPGLTQDLVCPALCFRLDEEETIATFSIGYADGYSRQLSGKGVVTTMDGETTGLSSSGFLVFPIIQWLYLFYFHCYSLSGFSVFFTDYSVVLSVFFSQLLLASLLYNVLLTWIMNKVSVSTSPGVLRSILSSQL